MSSTGHLILAGHALDFNGAEADTFYIAIQAGAIVAVCWHYRVRILSILRNLFKPGADQRLAVNTVVAFLPAAVLGVMVSSVIKTYLFNVYTVAAALVAGGLIILWVERFNERRGRAPRVATMDDMTWKDALGVGCMQCFALIPGTSRSGATIIGSLVLGPPPSSRFFLPFRRFSERLSTTSTSRATCSRWTIFRASAWALW